MRARGLTLIEMLISASLLLMIISVASTFLVEGMAAWTTATIKADDQNNVLVTFGKLANHLEHSDVGSLTVYTAPGTVCTSGSGTAISFLQSDGEVAYDSGTGDVLWDHYEVWYLATDSSSNLTGSSLYVADIGLPGSTATDPADTIAPNPYKLTSYTENGTRILSNVSTFAISTSVLPSILQLNAAQPVFQNPVNVQLQVVSSKQTLNNQTSVMMLESQTLDPPVAIP